MYTNNYYILIIISLMIGYLFGSIPCGYLVAKSKGVNIFEVGSKNPGSTNVGRVLGRKCGLIVFSLDIIKTVLPIAIIQCLLMTGCLDKLLNTNYINSKNFSEAIIQARKDMFPMLLWYTGLGAVAGHNFPFTTGFKGGKGITCTVAATFYFNVFYAIVLYLIHKILKKLGQYVSLASILTLIALFISACVLSLNRLYPFDFFESKKCLIPIGAMMIFGILRHASNIKRLIEGTENKA